jgi:hypothetical protein
VGDVHFKCNAVVVFNAIQSTVHVDDVTQIAWLKVDSHANIVNLNHVFGSARIAAFRECTVVGGARR